MEPKLVASYSFASIAPITSTTSFDHAFIANRASSSSSSKWLASIASKYLSYTKCKKTKSKIFEVTNGYLM
jgi:hypothetical protein